MNQNSPYVMNQARDDFNKARSKADISSILFALTPEKQQLISLEDVRSLLKPRSETYQGMKTVPIRLIIGSEGRYKDFTRTFLPKKEFIRNRWESIDRAHLSDIVLPPIKLYEINSVYFVRDGNHRVSVAKLQGRKDIDAEVIRLDTEIPITPSNRINALRNSVIQYEKDQVFQDTGLGKVIDPDSINFTATGRYVELLRHIQGHKYFMNLGKKREIPFLTAAESWYKNLFLPIIKIIHEENLLNRFPGRTEADLYMWIIKHWDALKKTYGDDISLKSAALDYTQKFGKGIREQILDFFKSIINRIWP